MGLLEAVRAEGARLQAWYDAHAGSPLRLGLTNWTYGGVAGDDHVEAAELLPVVMMGFNAGSGDHAASNRMSRSERSWRTRSSRLADAAPNRIVFAELISVPSHTQGDLGGRAESTEELMKVSAPLNRAIIAFHRPKVIFHAGLAGDHLAIVERLYGLESLSRGQRPSAPSQALFRSYVTADGVPWISFRHFAAQGFSIADREGIQDEARRLDWNGDKAS